jgi:hypothetical protein
MVPAGDAMHPRACCIHLQPLAIISYIHEPSSPDFLRLLASELKWISVQMLVLSNSITEDGS